MIEKLSDEMIIQNAKDWLLTTITSECGIISGQKKARDYYDAQIDKQAKTMEELCKMFRDTEIGKNENRKHMDTIIELVPENLWPEHLLFVCGFLAAGGTIKDGE